MRMVIVCEVKDVDAFMSDQNRAVRQANISTFADGITEYALEGENKIAVSCDVTDMSAMAETMASESTKAEMVSHGVLPDSVQTFFEHK